MSFRRVEADAILDIAAECGVNVINTAKGYGDHLSDKLMGDYLSRRTGLKNPLLIALFPDFKNPGQMRDNTNSADSVAEIFY